ncbi:MAG: DNA translocase FtsK, partial [Holosporaceae bacterium]
QGDELYKRALRIVMEEKKTSTSYLQRRLQIGYNRAARLIEELEANGVLSSPNHTGKRTLLAEVS